MYVIRQCVVTATPPHSLPARPGGVSADLAPPPPAGHHQPGLRAPPRHIPPAALRRTGTATVERLVWHDVIVNIIFIISFKKVQPSDTLLWYNYTMDLKQVRLLAFQSGSK